jgi:hypothetical protein
MQVAARDALRGQALAGAVRLQQHVDHFVAGQMAALEQHGLRAERQQFVGRAVERLDAVDGMADQQRRFVEIGRDHHGAREQLAHQHLHGFRGDQASPLVATITGSSTTFGNL